MKNFIEPGKTLELTAPYAVSSGAGAQIGSLFGVACDDIANAAVGRFAIRGVYSLAKASGAWTEGAKLYWDNTAKNVTTTSTSNLFIGHAAKLGGQASGDTTGYVRLHGASA